jgi:hypothetical protein
LAKNPKWSEEENKILFLEYEKGNKEDILSKLSGRNWQGITIHSARIGLYRMNYFTEDDISFIKENYDKLSSREIGLKIGRFGGTVGDKIRELGIIRQENWSEEESDILKENFGKCSVDYISKYILINRTKSSIYHQCQELGLARQTNRYSKKDLLNLLKDLSVELGRTPLCSELAEYGLPHNTTFIRHFGSYNTACEILGLDINVTIFSQTRYYYSKNMDKCRSRSEQIITNFLIDNNICYRMDNPYFSISNDPMWGRKRYDWLLDNNVVVEYFGLIRNKKYQERMELKISLCKKNNIELIQIFEKDIFKLKEIFGKFL